MKERKFKIIRDYYCEGNMYDKSMITLKAGFTVLTGCNGAGKTTLLHQIRHYLNNSEIEYVEYNNLIDGGHNAMEKMMWHGDTDAFSTMVLSSEGERIHQNIADIARKLGSKIKHAKKGEDFFVLFDAIDSGLSIDNILDIKDFIKNVFIPDYNKTTGGDAYIISVANEYEMANGEQCFDVQTCTYTTFEDYEDYKQYVLDTRKKKTARIDAYYEEKERKEKEARTLPLDREKGDEDDGSDE